MHALRFVLCFVLSAVLALPAQATAFLSPVVKAHEPEDAFGLLVHRSGSSSNAFLFCGEQYDADLGLYYLRARYLNSDSGRFWSMDSYEGGNSDPMSLHKYLYGNANPARFYDPSGRFSLINITAGVAITGTLALTAVPVVAAFHSSGLQEVSYDDCYDAMIQEFGFGLELADEVGILGFKSLAIMGAGIVSAEVAENIARQAQVTAELRGPTTLAAMKGKPFRMAASAAAAHKGAAEAARISVGRAALKAVGKVTGVATIGASAISFFSRAAAAEYCGVLSQWTKGK